MHPHTLPRTPTPPPGISHSAALRTETPGLWRLPLYPPLPPVQPTEPPPAVGPQPWFRLCAGSGFRVPGLVPAGPTLSPRPGDVGLHPRQAHGQEKGQEDSHLQRRLALGRSRTARSAPAPGVHQSPLPWTQGPPSCSSAAQPRARRGLTPPRSAQPGPALTRPAPRSVPHPLLPCTPAPSCPFDSPRHRGARGREA